MATVYTRTRPWDETLRTATRRNDANFLLNFDGVLSVLTVGPRETVEKSDDFFYGEGDVGKNNRRNVEVVRI